MFATIRRIVQFNKNYRIHVVYDDRRDLNKNDNNIEEIERVKFIRKSEMSRDDLVRYVNQIRPGIIYFPAWQDKDYFSVIKILYRKGSKSILIGGFDDIWHGSLRQKLGSIYFRIFLLKYFDFAWIAGKPQYSYVQRFGFKMSQIIGNLYSADTNTFSVPKSVKTKRMRRFLFVGRFVNEKGLDVLLKAFDSINSVSKDQWELCLIGTGALAKKLDVYHSEAIIIKPFMQKKELIEELKKGGVCVIPSRKDQWGLPVHEMALMGFPIIVSSAVGSASEFVISGYNGYVFENENSESLRLAMLKIIKLTNSEIECFGERSASLAQRINSEFSAASFLSVLETSRKN